MDGPKACYTEWSKPERKNQILTQKQKTKTTKKILTHIHGIYKNVTDELICRG